MKKIFVPVARQHLCLFPLVLVMVLFLLLSCATAPSAHALSGGARPAWINDPYTAYNRDKYIVAVGAGADRSEA